jgi:hypothetical protein
MVCYDICQILPKDGEIILGQDVVFSFPSTSEVDATCRERGGLHSFVSLIRENYLTEMFT